MRADITELAGILLVILGAGAVVAAASMVSTILGVLAAGALLVFAGIVVVYVARALESATPAPEPPQAPTR